MPYVDDEVKTPMLRLANKIDSSIYFSFNSFESVQINNLLGQYIVIQNPGQAPISFPTVDEYATLELQAKMPDSTWQSISVPIRGYCGNADGIVSLAPGHQWRIWVPRLEGIYRTKLRMMLYYYHPDTKTIAKAYSTEWTARINLSQVRKKGPIRPVGEYRGMHVWPDDY